MERESTLKHGSEPNPVDSIGLCLLSLDGGGVRGLSSLYILKSIMDRLNHIRGQEKLPPVKPCEVFDLIGGTSTGGSVKLPSLMRRANCQQALSRSCSEG